MKAYQVVVAGGGLTGVAAAVAARRGGAESVLLIERYGFLGGAATNGLVNPFMTYWTEGHYGDPRHRLVKGIFAELLERLQALGCLRDDRVSFDAEGMKLALQRMALEEGVALLLHSLAEAVHIKDGDRLSAIRVASKSGVEYIAGKVFIDCTGDGDIACLCGVPYENGRKEDGFSQPMTLSFRMAGVDKGRMPSNSDINAAYRAAIVRGEIHNPREDVLYFNVMQEDVVHFNTTRVVKRDGASAEGLTAAEIEAREQVWEMAAFLKKEIPGFENAYLQTTAPQIGVRESRRILGEYLLTEKDVLGCARFPDAVARCSYNIDIHNPAGTGTTLIRLPEGGYYEIPWRCMFSLRIRNLICAGRCISSSHEAHSSLRIMPTCAALGQAAGTAAALSILRGVHPCRLAGEEIRAQLEKDGAL